MKIEGRFENLAVDIQDYINRMCAKTGRRRFKKTDKVSLDTDFLPGNERKAIESICIASGIVKTKRERERTVSAIVDPLGRPIFKNEILPFSQPEKSDTQDMRPKSQTIAAESVVPQKSVTTTKQNDNRKSKRSKS